jgi:hypothetical protein
MVFGAVVGNVLDPDRAHRHRSAEQRTPRLLHRLEQLGHKVTLESND